MSFNPPNFNKSVKHPIFKEYVDGFDDIIYELCRMNDRGEIDEYNKEDIIKQYTQKVLNLQDPERIEYFKKIFEHADKLKEVSEK